MSDAEVCAAIEALEAWVADAAAPLEPAFLADWNGRFQAAVATAERGAGWEGLLARAHRLAGQVALRQAAAEEQREAIRTELRQQEQGSRALRGYGASTR